MQEGKGTGEARKIEQAPDPRNSTGEGDQTLGAIAQSSKYPD